MDIGLRQITWVSNGDLFYDKRGNRSWNGMLFASKKHSYLITYYRYIYLVENFRLLGGSFEGLICGVLTQSADLPGFDAIG
jgi:hypothetical protein